MSELQISFPNSSEDHRLQLIKINDSIFAIVHSPLESLGPINLNCEDWSLILLAPIKSKTNIVISAINVICLNEIASEEGKVNIHASNRLVKLTPLNNSPEKAFEINAQDVFQFHDDPGAFLHYYRLFYGIVASIHSGNSSSFSEAQQNFIQSLCTLTDRIKGGQKNLTLPKVLTFWNVLHQKTSDTPKN